MKPGPLQPLSSKVRDLLSAERAIVPQSELRRRRAQLRARAALWQMQSQPAAGWQLVKVWRRARLVAVTALFTTAGLAGWFTLGPEPAPEQPAAAVVKPPPSSVPSAPVPLATTPPAEPSQPQPPSSSQAENGSKSASAPPQGVTPARAKPVPAQPLQELRLLDQARRAVAAAEFGSALKLIQRHGHLFPNSQLREEREALRVRALQGAGLSAKAETAAGEFESRYPNSVFTPQLKKSGSAAP